MATLDLIWDFNAITADNLKDINSILTFIIDRLLPDFLNIWASFFAGLADIVPVFIYYHAATAVDVLTQQWQSITMNLILNKGKDKEMHHQIIENQQAPSVFEKETRQISHLYDSLVHLVSRADIFSVTSWFLINFFLFLWYVV